MQPGAIGASACRELPANLGRTIGSANRVLRRLEGALNRLPARIAGSLATQEGGGGGCASNTRPRTRTRPSDWGVASVTA